MKKIISLFLPLLIAGLCSADENKLSSADENKLGFFLSFLKPTPGGLGLEITYNYNEDIRLSAGVSSVIFWSTIGIGGQYFFTHNIIRPYIGVQLTHTSGLDADDDDSFLVILDAGETTGGSIDFGLDWATDTGFTMGLGASVLINSFVDDDILPHFYIGWIF